MNKLLPVWLLGIAVTIAGCMSMSESSSGPTQKPGTVGDVCGGKWELSLLRINGQAIPVDQPSEFTFLCNSGGEAMGKSGINTYRGSMHVTDNGQILWDTGSFASTKMAGPPQLMDQEAQYLSALARTRQAFVKSGGGRLILRDASGDVYIEYVKANY
ncbi:META domain-containing protein [Microbulbifer agarilyticus]|uniref:META domain-containing protein n=1 Tax=Microbulbifer agarilyticus TaxID=260552 RepID=UPI001C93D770|nr:META domain-containing protein [Microbulbifer agarilyticus]MBY6191149.1 META domain-containing protein [Microbulbifer agarilyticus]MBY6211750.1 META domain-containing protein [Microbulbifer agarilyticus]MCA0893225.1 META domain-containing protein [Microbulbifer agarilyticus]